MAGEPRDPEDRPVEASEGPVDAPVCQRLRVVTALLVTVALLGLATTTLLAMDLSGEGLDSLLGDGRADVSGQVREGDGRLVPGATVTCLDGDESSVTGISGYYFLEGIEAGKTRIKMEAEGYVTVVKTVQLERGDYILDFYAENGTGTIEVKGDPVARPADALSGRVLLVVGVAVCSAFALLGAVASHLRRWYPLVIVGCLLGTFTWGWFVGSIISVVCLLVALPLRAEFGRKTNPFKSPWSGPLPPSIEPPEDEAIDAIPVTGPDVRADGPGGMPPGG